MLSLLLAAALAQDAPVAEVIGVDTTASDTYVFAIRSCDRVRAVVHDERPPEVQRSPKLVLTVRNLSGQMCLYRGLALEGSLSGTYVSSLGDPDGTGFFVPPGGEISFRVEPSSPASDRAAVTLQIPPGSGTMIFRGYGPDDAPPKPDAR